MACLARDLELDPRNPRTAGLRAPKLYAKWDNSTNGENKALLMTSKRATR
ncbi:hypothetical protein GCM10007897_45030 [Sphingobium jiangsuense]|nr:hypothetical protein GCM10007897_45030 [Sphingobium jiangsuense]